jgi:precorrin-6A/cobalt-precorrin-6A reductase
MTVLVLGGTSEGRELAELLRAEGITFLSSLAGRVLRPRLPVGKVRIGGFGGAPGLAEFLADRQIVAVVDATHPFAQGMSRNATQACASAGVPLLRLERPGWSGAPGSQGWHWVDDHAEAAQRAAAVGHRPFLTVGRQALDHFTGPLADHATLVRVVDQPQVELPTRWRVLTSRGPYEQASERALMREHDIDVIVTKDSGGQYTWPKLAAAEELEIPVLIVRRTELDDGVETVSDPDAALRWVRRHCVAGDAQEPPG